MEVKTCLSIQPLVLHRQRRCHMWLGEMGTHQGGPEQGELLTDTLATCGRMRILAEDNEGLRSGRCGRVLGIIWN